MVDHVGHRVAEHQVEVGLVCRVIDGEDIRLVAADIEEVLACRIVEDAPVFGADHKGHRDLGVLVGGPHAEQFAAVLDMVAARAAAALETFAVFEGDGKDAGVFIVTGFRHVLG